MVNKTRKLNNIKYGSLGVELKKVEKHITDDGDIFYIFILYYGGQSIKHVKYVDNSLKNLRKVITSHIVGCLGTYLKMKL